jgi:hypothetical protein
MLDRLLADFSDVPGAWPAGQRFGFVWAQGPDGERASFPVSYAAEAFGLLIQTPRPRTLEIVLPQPAVLRLATAGVYGASAPRGDLVVTFSAWHTIVGAAPPGASLALSLVGGEEAEFQGALWVTFDDEHHDGVALGMGRLGRFAVAYGHSVEEAGARVRAGLAADPATEAAARLAELRQMPGSGTAEQERPA